MNVLSPVAAVSSVSTPGDPPERPLGTREASSRGGSLSPQPTDASRLHPVATEVSGWAARLAGWVRTRRRRGEAQLSAEDLAQAGSFTGDAVATAVGALEGTLKGKSLDGALKDAQISEAYASARQKNADAEKLEAEAAKIRMETEKLRQELLIERLEYILRLEARFAPTPSVVDPNDEGQGD